MSFSKVLDVSLLESIPSVVRLGRPDDIAALVCVAIITAIYLLRGVTWDKPDPYNYVWYEKPQQEDIHGTKTAATRDIGVKLAESNKQIVIFWGSQSGTAEGLANRLARDCRNHFAVDAIACDLQDYDPESIANIPASKIAIFIVSTYGEGDPSDNATPLMSWLEFNRLTTKVPFQNLQYAAFGLGNKNYRLYNRVIDLLTEALDAMEAKALLPTGKADDSRGTTEEDFTEWKHCLFGMFREKLGLEERPDEYHPSLKVVEDTSLDIIDLHLGEPLHNTNAPSSSQIHHLPVKSAKKLLKSEDRNCLHVEFDISEHVGLKYKTGDHLAVYPSNPEHEIVRLLDVLGLESNKATPLLISSLEPLDKCKIPSPTTLYALFQSYLEICAPVGRETVSALAKFAPSPSAKARLSQLGADKELYHDYCSKNHVTFGRLLESTLEPGDKNSWSSLPLSFILESLPVLTPRYYSISSSAVISPRRIDITVATSTHNANLQPIPGLTTSYLLNHTQTVNDRQDSRVFAHIRTSKFRLPTAFSASIILVAAGSGIAPFRAFIAERARMRSLGKAVGKTILFFGCRSASEDFLYQDELKKISEASEGNFEILTAFSRKEVNSKGGKMYVQDRVEERGDEMLKLLMEQDASLYICGSAGMAREVGGRLRSMFVDRLAWNEDRVKEWLERMRKTRKWQEDVWG